MQKEILTELEDLRDETEFIINNQEIVENKHIENYLRSFERIRNNLFNKIKLSNKYEVNEQDKITYLNDRYSATVENDILKIYIPEVIPKYKNINNCAYKNIMLNVMDKTKEYKDLFNKENVEKVVSAVTGKNTVDMTGTWSYTGAAIEFESDNLLMKAGGAVAATTAEAKLNEQLSKVGIKPGQMSFTFNADSTFNAKLGTKTLNGTYMYNATEKHVTMKFVRLINMNAKVNCTSGSMDLLFESDKLLKLITFLSSKSSNATLKTISSLANSYDGMMLGFSLEKKE